MFEDEFVHLYKYICRWREVSLDLIAFYFVDLENGVLPIIGDYEKKDNVYRNEKKRIWIKDNVYRNEKEKDLNLKIIYWEN